MKQTLGSFSLVALLLPVAPSFAQQTPPPEPGPTIRHTVQEVVLNVVVRDSKGRIVKNLKPSDLTVEEDGKPQEIRSFRLVQGHDIVEKNKAEAGPPIRNLTANPLKATNLVCIVFSNLSPYTKKYAVDAVREFLKSQLEPDTWIAIFNLDTKLTPLQAFTTDRNAVMEAANRAFTGAGVDFAQVATAVLSASPNVVTMEISQSGTLGQGGTVSVSQNIAGGELSQRSFTGADVSNSDAANRQRGDLAGQRRTFGGIEGMRETDQVLAMIRQLGTLPGRKSVLFFSPGLATTGDADLFKLMVDNANKAGVTVYAVDVNGLSADIDQSQASVNSLAHVASVSASQSSRGSNAAQNMEKMRQSDYVNDAVRTTDTQASLRALSEGTGGFLIGSTNDLRKPFQRLLEEVDTHYEVTYTPSSEVYDGRLRTIAVKSPRGDLNIESRTGYFALPALESSSVDLPPFEISGLAALSLKKPFNAFTFNVETYQFRPDAASSQNGAVFEIPVGNLQATPEPGANRHRLHVSLVALVKDSSGQVVDKFTKDSSYQIPDENLAKAQATSISFEHPMPLPPGRYTLDTAVLDQEKRTISTSTTSFDSPDLKGVGLSSILLVRNFEPVNGKTEVSDPFEMKRNPTQVERVVPELNTNIPANASPSVFFVVYPDHSIAEKPKIQAEFWLNGQQLAKQVADLPAPDASGTIPVTIAAAAKPGNCELRITAMQGNTSKTQSLKYTVAAK